MKFNNFFSKERVQSNMEDVPLIDAINQDVHYLLLSLVVFHFILKTNYELFIFIKHLVIYAPRFDNPMGFFCHFKSPITRDICHRLGILEFW